MGRLDNKVAFVTGAARGQGRSHAIRLAQEGADIVGIDICAEMETVPYPTATPDDLAETVKQVEELDRRMISRQADVRDLAALQSVVEEANSEFGGIDIVSANAGIVSAAPSWELTEEQFQEMIDVNLTGVWKTTKAVIPSMIERGRGGSIILTSSLAGVVAYGNLSHYVAAKHGVTGLMRSLAVELAQHNIRVNSVHPTTVDTPMIHNEAMYKLFFPDLENPTREKVEEAFLSMNGMRIPYVEAIDISNAVLFLASDEARYITGTTQLVNAGADAPFRFPHA
ncbi:MAG TPA: mycofactocin-coupled SDR family oxidoreductase [Pseudonocardia sp.]|jgi:SDR family mycofactocin-dependent oxidoreductase|nr:mycofactocin-coupled SDR family oxidoreductase [Pseudonocardia sp.]